MRSSAPASLGNLPLIVNGIFLFNGDWTMGSNSAWSKKTEGNAALNDGPKVSYIWQSITHQRNFKFMVSYLFSITEAAFLLNDLFFCRCMECILNP